MHLVCRTAKKYISLLAIGRRWLSLYLGIGLNLNITLPGKVRSISETNLSIFI